MKKLAGGNILTEDMWTTALWICNASNSTTNDLNKRPPTSGNVIPSIFFHSYNIEYERNSK